MKKSKLFTLLLIFSCFLVPSTALADDGTNEYTSTEQTTESTESATKESTDFEDHSALSVTGQKFEGTGTVVDYTFTDSRIFYTIETEDNKIFYLIIDRNKSTNNAYFLREINETELNTIAKPVQSEPVITPVVTEKTNNTTNNTLIFGAIAIAGCGLLYVYLNFKKKQDKQDKQDETVFEDFDELEDEDDEIGDDE